MDLTWKFDSDNIDWSELSNLYRIAPLGEKSPNDLQVTFGNSRYQCFVYAGDMLIGAGRALADGIDCSYLCDVAVHPDHQGLGVGKGIVRQLVELSKNHRKIILYANVGKEGFYWKLGFRRMNTAMAIFQDQDRALAIGLVSET